MALQSAATWKCTRCVCSLKMPWTSLEQFSVVFVLLRLRWSDHEWCSLSVFAPEGDLALGTVSRALVEHGALVEGRAVQVQAHGRFTVARVLNPVQAQRIVDVGDAVQLQLCVALLGHGRLHAVLGLRPVEANLLQRTGQNLHEAVRVGVVVDAATLSLGPAKDHQVELAVAFVDQVSRVPVPVELGVLLPFLGVALVR